MKVLVGKNFKNIALDQSKFVFVEFCESFLFNVPNGFMPVCVVNFGGGN